MHATHLFLSTLVLLSESHGRLSLSPSSYVREFLRSTCQPDTKTVMYIYSVGMTNTTKSEIHQICTNKTEND